MTGTNDLLWYLDSNVLVAFLQNQDILVGDYTRGQLAKWVVDQGAAGKVRLFTSTLGIIEANGGNANPDPVLREKIDRFFQDENPIELIDIDFTVAELARSLTWQLRDSGRPVKNNIDIAHLAAAKVAECTDLLTFDSKHLLNLDGCVDGIRIRQPTIDGQASLM